MRRQLAAMPNELYLVRLIHAVTKSCCPGERLWTASLLTHGATVRFLRARNREGFDVYLYPYADRGNSGYILVDLDGPQPQILPTMRAQGHEPCVLVQTSPGHLQAWIRVSTEPLHPVVASAIGRHLARTYGGDPASTDWRHLGRLAGFTNQKPQRRMDGYAPWVKLLHAKVGLATHGASLVEAAVPQLPHPILAASASDHATGLEAPDPFLTVSAATAIYRAWLQRLRIPQRFPLPDWSIADLWIAKELLACGTPMLKSTPSSSSVVRAFPAATLIPTITCAAHWHAPCGNSRLLLFRRALRLHAVGTRSWSTPLISLSRDPLCAPCVDRTSFAIPIHHRRVEKNQLMTPSLGSTCWHILHRVRTPPADSNPVPNAAVSGCRSSPGSARWSSALPPDPGIPGDILLHT